MCVAAPHTSATARIWDPSLCPNTLLLLCITLSYSLLFYFPFRLTCRLDLFRRMGRGPPHAVQSPECGLADGAPRHGSVPEEEGYEEGGKEGE